MFGTCKDCRHWGVWFEGMCARVTHIQTAVGSKQFTIEAMADDDQGLEAHLMTGPDFGCIHFDN